MKPENGKEYPELNEEQNAAAMTAVMRKSLLKDYASGKMLRRFHAKTICLVEAIFTIEKLPANLQVGIFKEPKTFKALVRFSNGNKSISGDFKKAVRGLAIKLIDLGENALVKNKMGQTQDFLLTTNPIFFPGTVNKYKLTIKGLFENFFFLLLILLNPFNWRGAFAMFASSILVPNLLEQTYFSATPYLFGEGMAVKWQARPMKKADSTMPAHPDPDFLSAQLAADLSGSAYSFEFFMQQQTDPVTEPVEDSSVEWKTPVIKIATLTILQQDIDIAARRAQAESMTFSPWHCLPQHRPLGGINRVRKAVYTELAAFRNEQNDK